MTSDFLRHPASDVATVVLFGAAGAFVEAGLWPVQDDLFIAAGLVIACLGPLGCAIERGGERSLRAWQGVGLAALAAGAHLLGLLRWLADPHPPGLVGRALAIVVVGAALTRLGPRLDRGEAGWRAAARAGPPHGTSRLARAIAGWRPEPIAALERLTRPLLWPARLPAVVAIRVYQLTLSRLMPPACQFEPTCSRYGLCAFWKHGVLRGGALTTLRIIRCSPLSCGGFDPVPGRDGAPACQTPEVSCPPSRPPSNGAPAD